ncbi:MAG: WYL domain-containing protein [bacterium]|nr:WYL domain-containing protein [bacterium]
MARNKQLLRHLNIIRYLDSKYGVTIPDLVRIFGVSRRTIERDLATLSDAGFPIYDDLVNGQKRWKFVDGYKSNIPMPFTISEILSLYLSRNILAMFGTTLFRQDLETLVKKIETFLPEKTLRYFDRFPTVFQSRYVAQEQYPYLAKVMPELEQAILDEKAVTIEYYSASKEKWRTYHIEPYAIFPTYDRLYLAAFLPKHREILLFTISRIRKITPTNISFKKPKEFKVSEFMRDAFGIMRGEPQNFVVRFNQPVVSVVKSRCQHMNHTCKELPNGDMILTLCASGWDEIKWWILSFGENAEVIEPKQLRNEIITTLKTTLKKYSQ